MTKYIELSIKLLDIQPEIIRTFVVPDFITLDRLHDVLQIIMGWEGRHLYSFEFKNGQVYSEPFEDDSSDCLHAGEVRLSELVKRRGTVFKYNYDFGDDWWHELRVLDMNIIEYYGQSLMALSGSRACPPEDVGGIWGYNEFCETLKKPRSQQYRENMEWLGYKYDPEFFDINKVNGKLAYYILWTRPRLLPWIDIKKED